MQQTLNIKQKVCFCQCPPCFFGTVGTVFEAKEAPRVIQQSIKKRACVQEGFSKVLNAKSGQNGSQTCFSPSISTPKGGQCEQNGSFFLLKWEAFLVTCRPQSKSRNLEQTLALRIQTKGSDPPKMQLFVRLRVKNECQNQARKKRGKNQLQG